MMHCQLEEYRDARRKHFWEQKINNCMSHTTSVANSKPGETEQAESKNKRRWSERDVAERMSLPSKTHSPPQEKRRKRLPRIVQRDPRVEWLMGRRPEEPLSETIDENQPQLSGSQPSRTPVGECYEVCGGTISSFAPTAPSSLRLLTWNIDGLDSEHLLSRTRSVVETILVTNADVVFLQEVVPSTFELFGYHLAEKFHIVCAEPQQGMKSGCFLYFCVILLSKRKFGDQPDHIESTNFWFPNSEMGRHLLTARCSMKGSEVTPRLCFLTSHLESCREASDERKAQLLLCYQHMRRAVDEHGAELVVFGGDLNLRDREAKAVATQLSNAGGCPLDVWEALGSPSETRYTWDAQRSNGGLNALPYKVRMRFDRVYFHTPQKESLNASWHPAASQLVGRWRLSVSDKSPSDHFGVLIDFASTQ